MKIAAYAGCGFRLPVYLRFMSKDDRLRFLELCSHISLLCGLNRFLMIQKRRPVGGVLIDPRMERGGMAFSGDKRTFRADSPFFTAVLLHTHMTALFDVTPVRIACLLYEYCSSRNRVLLSHP